MKENSINKKAKKQRQNLLRTLFWLAAVGSLLWVILKRSGEIAQELQSVSWVQLINPLLLLVLILPLMGLNSWVSLRYLDSRYSYLEAAGFYFGSQGPKYLPGGFWAFPSRMVFYSSKGTSATYAILSVFREVAALFLSAAAVGVVGVLQGITTLEVRWAVLLGALFSLAAILLTSFSGFWKLVSRIPPGIQLPFSDLIKDKEKRSLRWLLPTFSVSVVFWLALGLPFQNLIQAIEPSVQLSWLQAASIFALAWCGGFVVVVIPAGLGVRETLLTILLSQFMPESSALTIALTARIWWMLAEAVYIVISLFWLTRTIRFKPALQLFRKKNVNDMEGEDNARK